MTSLFAKINQIATDFFQVKIRKLETREKMLHELIILCIYFRKDLCWVGDDEVMLMADGHSPGDDNPGTMQDQGRTVDPRAFYTVWQESQ